MKLLIVDTETTGLDKEKDNVIEVAAILYSVKHRTILQQISTLLPVISNPQERINKISVEATQEYLTDLREPMFNMGQQSDYIVAHNAEFDKQWFDDESLAIFKTDRYDNIPWICTCHEFDFPNQTRQGQSLVELALLHNVPVVSAHRALTDCQLIASIFDKLEDLEDRIKLAAEPRFDCVANVSYDNRQLAKDNGFRWNPESRTWNRKLSERQVKELPFSVSKTNSYKIVI
jgi:DNA polymerase-3 subunit epsilon